MVFNVLLDYLVCSFHLTSAVGLVLPIRTADFFFQVMFAFVHINKIGVRQHRYMSISEYAISGNIPCQNGRCFK